MWPFCLGLTLALTLKSVPDAAAIQRWRFVLVRWAPLLSAPLALVLGYPITTST
jgi:hypothetical protein